MRKTTFSDSIFQIPISTLDTVFKEFDCIAALKVLYTTLNFWGVELIYM